MKPGEMIVRSPTLPSSSGAGFSFDSKGRIIEKGHSVARTLSSEKNLGSSIEGTFASSAGANSHVPPSSTFIQITQAAKGADDSKALAALGAGLTSLTLASAYSGYQMDTKAEEWSNKAFENVDNMLRCLEKPDIIDKDFESKYDLVVTVLKNLEDHTQITFNNYSGKSPILGQVKVAQQSSVGNSNSNLLLEIFNETIKMDSCVKSENDPIKKIEKLYNFFKDSKNPISNSLLKNIVNENGLTISTMFEDFSSSIAQFLFKFL